MSTKQPPDTSQQCHGETIPIVSEDTPPPVPFPMNPSPARRMSDVPLSQHQRHAMPPHLYTRGSFTGSDVTLVDGQPTPRTSPCAGRRSSLDAVTIAMPPPAKTSHSRSNGGVNVHEDQCKNWDEEQATIDVGGGSSRRPSDASSETTPSLKDKKMVNATTPPTGCCGRYKRLPRRQKWMWCCGCFIVFLIIFNAIMLTVGVKAIAQFAVNNMYPPEFDIQAFTFDDISIGPMSGSTVAVAVHAKVPPGANLPVNVRIRRPMTVDVVYLQPPMMSINQDQFEALSLETENNEAAQDQPLFLGNAELIGEDMVLTTDPNAIATMNIDLNVQNPVAFALMVDHLMGYGNETGNPVLNPDISKRVNYSAPVLLDVNVLVSAVDVMIGSTTILSIPNLVVKKKILLKDPAAMAAAPPPTAQNMNQVGQFFDLVSRVLAGDKEVLQYASEYMSLSELTMYDEIYNNPVPELFAEYYPYEFAWREAEGAMAAGSSELQRPVQQDPEDHMVLAGVNLARRNVSETEPIADGNLVVAGVTMPSDSRQNEEGAFVGVGWPKQRGDPNSMPFSLKVTFYNPTNISLSNIGSFMVLMNYTDVSIANVTVHNMELRPNGYTNVTVIGYLRKEIGREEVLEQEVPRAVLKAITTGKYEKLPFSLSGAPIVPISARKEVLANASAQMRESAGVGVNMTDILLNVTSTKLPPALEGQPLFAAIQSMLANRMVMIGHYYTDLGPLYYPPNATEPSLALAKIFQHIPVLGTGGMGDVLQGLKLHFKAKGLRGIIPVSAWISNPFGCGIGIRDISLGVYPEPFMSSKPLGWVSMPAKTEVKPDERHKYVVPVLMPPGYHMDDIDSFFNSTTDDVVSGVNDTKTLMKSIEPQFYFKANIGGIFKNLGAVMREFRHTVKAKEFVVSMNVEKLDLRLGRFEWTIRNITTDGLAQIRLFPKDIVERVGWLPLMKMLFGPGWNMVDIDGESMFGDEPTDTTFDYAQ